jgi:hypothetical protein
MSDEEKHEGGEAVKRPHDEATIVAGHAPQAFVVSVGGVGGNQTYVASEGIAGAGSHPTEHPAQVASRAGTGEHPAPWRWREYGMAWGLEDANCADVLTLTNDASWIELASPLAREMIRLAPEMEAALRLTLGELREYGSGHSPADNKGERAAATILAALDAARKAP